MNQMLMPRFCQFSIHPSLVHMEICTGTLIIQSKNIVYRGIRSGIKIHRALSLSECKPTNNNKPTDNRPSDFSRTLFCLMTEMSPLTHWRSWGWRYLIACAVTGNYWTKKSTYNTYCKLLNIPLTYFCLIFVMPAPCTHWDLSGHYCAGFLNS